MISVSSPKRGWRAVGPRRIHIPWLAVVWLALIALSWALMALPFVLWGWRGGWVYLAVFSLWQLVGSRMHAKSAYRSSKAQRNRLQ